MDQSDNLTLSKMDKMALALKEQAIPIKIIHSNILYKLNKYNYYNDCTVIPEFYTLINVPFSLSLSLNFSDRVARTSVSEQPRRQIINRVLRRVNKRILSNHPSIKSRKTTVHAAWVIEYGAFDGEDNRHAHLMLHFDKAPAREEKAATQAYLSSLTNEELEELGISSLNVQDIDGNQTDCIWYFCKNQRGREFKTVDYSRRFFPVIERKFLSKEAPYFN